jgi:hypothetical protein
MRPEPTAVSRLQETARNWVSTHRNALPTEFASYATFSYPHRRAIYRELDWATRERLWRAQLETFLLPEERLTPVQREMLLGLEAPLTAKQKAFIQFAVDSVVAFAYKPNLTKEQRQAIVKRACRAAPAVLGKTGTKRIFGLIGPSDRNYMNALLQRQVNHASMSMFGLSKNVELPPLL